MSIFKKKPRCKLCDDKITDDNKYKVVLETLEGDHIVSPVCDPCVVMLNHIHDGVQAALEKDEDEEDG